MLSFATDADTAGVEKIAVCKINPMLLQDTMPALSRDNIVTDVSFPDTLPPMSVFYVKGYTRCFCAIVCLAFAYENPDVLEAWVVSDSNSQDVTSLIVVLQFCRGVPRGGQQRSSRHWTKTKLVS